MGRRNPDWKTIDAELSRCFDFFAEGGEVQIPMFAVSNALSLLRYAALPRLTDELSRREYENRVVLLSRKHLGEVLQDLHHHPEIQKTVRSYLLSANEVRKRRKSENEAGLDDFIV